MTQKLKILGPYTAEHEGPYAFNGEVCVVHAVLGHQAFISRLESDSGFIACLLDIKNAEEIPQPREFWIVEYPNGGFEVFRNQEELRVWGREKSYPYAIHVREVMPGEGE